VEGGAGDEAGRNLEDLSREELVALLQTIEVLQGDEFGAALAAAIAAKGAPLGALSAAHAAIEEWANGEPERLLYADEVTDIARRVAGDIAAGP
jgi:hypothetical protein